MYASLFTWNLLAIGTIRGLIISLIAMGIVLIYRSSRVINFAVGDLGVPAAGLLAGRAAGLGEGVSAGGAAVAPLPVGVDPDIAPGGLASGGAMGIGTELGLGVHGLAPTACDWRSRCPQNQLWAPS